MSDTKNQLDGKDREALIDLCVDIFAHCELDYEVTLGGNGTNPSEAANVAYAVLDAVGIDSGTLDDQVAARVEELEKEYG